MESIEFLSGFVVVSPRAEQLAEFYRDVIGVELEAEDHGGLETHWAAELGDIQFAIHPDTNFPGTPAGPAPVRMSFIVFDLDTVLSRLEDHGVESLYPLKDDGFGRTITLRDPDGNFVELTELNDVGFEHLDRRKREGFDPVARWKQRRR